MPFPVLRKKKKVATSIIGTLPVVEEEVESEIPLEEDEEAPGYVEFDASQLSVSVQKLLKFSTFEPEQRYWLDTGSPELNAVFGSRERGIPYGKILELRGEEHAGKSTLSLIMAAMAQQNGAAVGRIDLEDSRDAVWDEKCGLHPSSIVNIYPKLIQYKTANSDDNADDEESKPDPKKKKKKKRKPVGAGLPILQTAEELFAEAEVTMALLAKRGFKRQFWFLDSVANIQTEMAVDAGMDRSMRISLDRAAFLSQVLPKWAGLAANYNATIFLINQLRDKQGIVFGDPTTSPGGRALRHACSIRAQVRRCKNGQVKRGNKVIGLVGVIKNFKNKAGGGSFQNCECGFRILWHKTPAIVEFMTREEADELLK